MSVAGRLPALRTGAVDCRGLRASASAAPSEDVGVCRPEQGNRLVPRGGRSSTPNTRALLHSDCQAGLSRPSNSHAGREHVTLTPRWAGSPMPASGHRERGCDSFAVRECSSRMPLSMKNFAITERVKAQFRMDVFNFSTIRCWASAANQGGSGTCIDCSGNGRITDIEADSSPGSTTGMRQLEFALKFSF